MRGAMTRVAVLGAGLQGASVALELAANAVDVDLYDQAGHCLAGASSSNEGKIHFGYVYANDPSLRTARTLIEGALAFSPLLRRWLGPGTDRLPVSPPFDYVVHRDSLLDPGAVERHLHAAHEVVLAASDGGRADYFGRAYADPPARRAVEGTYGRDVLAAFTTPEVAIDAEALARLVDACVRAHPGITTRWFTTVHGVVELRDSVGVESVNGAGSQRRAYDHVVNTLWDGRLAVDRTFGLRPPRPWLNRVKYYLRIGARALPPLPCTTIVLGSFGDLVTYAGCDAYLSWYPCCMRAASSDLVPPHWPLELDPQAETAVRDGTYGAMREIIPALAGLDETELTRDDVRGGVIFAWGETDIDDPSSELHERHAIGPRSHGRYHTVDTGKLTMAPLFGKRLADTILAAG